LFLPLKLLSEFSKQISDHNSHCYPSRMETQGG